MGSVNTDHTAPYLVASPQVQHKASASSSQAHLSVSTIWLVDTEYGCHIFDRDCKSGGHKCSQGGQC